ncbi:MULTISPECIES: hypothetical protein [Inquilinus]|uniref:Uncharacterized protein n=1 Tax=Inquilinus ginsengisoli TaxID=363840 RepID=A0ABU1JW18_9PROT|nr:hypothetical protein [Inquilinus ginsengisoli]MDR6292817.1 hypothetical protein [Inquilinus ginsengisoli]
MASGDLPIESATTMHLIHDDDEIESPFDLIREIATIVGWVATTFALLLLAYAAIG